MGFQIAYTVRGRGIKCVRKWNTNISKQNAARLIMYWRNYGRSIARGRGYGAKRPHMPATWDRFAAKLAPTNAQAGGVLVSEGADHYYDRSFKPCPCRKQTPLLPQLQQKNLILQNSNDNSLVRCTHPLRFFTRSFRFKTIYFTKISFFPSS